ncbi:MAG TPA: SPOR domain-containing protein [Candidatus Polarisedimenticolaceae bacterium]|nr:SPOR domain-containing protein [Candidatus Polarisedimenticolaceae bacterium]
MAPEGGGRDEPRELRLEGLTLFVAGGVLLALLYGAFTLGRTVERWNAPTRAASASADPLGNVESEPAEAAEKPTFFDTTTGPGKEAEPKREAQLQPTAPVPAPVASATPGSWYVQVFVGRDQQAAQEVVRTLRGLGYPVRADAVAEGRSGSLYKVRVGGYATKDLADAGAEKLHRDGQNSTWVVKVGG